MNQKLLLSMTTVIMLAYGSIAHAAPICQASNRLVAENYPGASSIYTSNNLLRAAGKAVEAEGQKLIITGQILDTSCAPVADAVVELWQNNPYGRWIMANNADLANPNPTFTGAGRTYTDADGRFTFITAFPAPLVYELYNKKGRPISIQRAPFVNIKIKKEPLADFTTALLFANDARNETDPRLKKLKPKTREDVTLTMQEDADGALVGSVKLVLPAKVAYRVY
jgi:protocatechuate 3,4-dioxygenase beta subunit